MKLFDHQNRASRRALAKREEFEDPAQAGNLDVPARIFELLADPDRKPLLTLLQSTTFSERRAYLELVRDLGPVEAAGLLAQAHNSEGDLPSDQQSRNRTATLLRAAFERTPHAEKGAVAKLEVEAARAETVARLLQRLAERTHGSASELGNFLSAQSHATVGGALFSLRSRQHHDFAKLDRLMNGALSSTPKPGNAEVSERYYPTRSTAVAMASRIDGAATHAAPEEHAVVDGVSLSGGQSLDEIDHKLASHLSSLFGHEFSSVRIHTDAAANELCARLYANAVTIGHHIFFAPDRFAPGSALGRRLLTHELTHVVQHQEGRLPSRSQERAVSRPSDATEVEAKQAESQADQLFGDELGRKRQSIRQVQVEQQSVAQRDVGHVAAKKSSKRVFLHREVVWNGARFVITLFGNKGWQEKKQVNWQVDYRGHRRCTLDSNEQSGSFSIAVEKPQTLMPRLHRSGHESRRQALTLDLYGDESCKFEIVDAIETTRRGIEHLITVGNGQFVDVDFFLFHLAPPSASERNAHYLERLTGENFTDPEGLVLKAEVLRWQTENGIEPDVTVGQPTIEAAETAHPDVVAELAMAALDRKRRRDRAEAATQKTAMEKTRADIAKAAGNDEARRQHLLSVYRTDQIDLRHLNSKALDGMAKDDLSVLLRKLHTYLHGGLRAGMASHVDIAMSRADAGEVAAISDAFAQFGSGLTNDWRALKAVLTKKKQTVEDSSFPDVSIWEPALEKLRTCDQLLRKYESDHTRIKQHLYTALAGLPADLSEAELKQRQEALISKAEDDLEGPAQDLATVQAHILRAAQDCKKAEERLTKYNERRIAGAQSAVTFLKVLEWAGDIAGMFVGGGGAAKGISALIKFGMREGATAFIKKYATKAALVAAAEQAGKIFTKKQVRALAVKKGAEMALVSGANTLVKGMVVEAAEVHAGVESDENGKVKKEFEFQKRLLAAVEEAGIGFIIGGSTHLLSQRWLSTGVTKFFQRKGAQWIQRLATRFPWIVEVVEKKAGRALAAHEVGALLSQKSIHFFVDLIGMQAVMATVTFFRVSIPAVIQLMENPSLEAAEKFSDQLVEAIKQGIWQGLLQHAAMMGIGHAHQSEQTALAKKKAAAALAQNTTGAAQETPGPMRRPAPELDQGWEHSQSAAPAAEPKVIVDEAKLQGHEAPQKQADHSTGSQPLDELQKELDHKHQMREEDAALRREDKQYQKETHANDQRHDALRARARASDEKNHQVIEEHKTHRAQDETRDQAKRDELRERAKESNEKNRHVVESHETRKVQDESRDKAKKAEALKNKRDQRRAEIKAQDERQKLLEQATRRKNVADTAARKQAQEEARGEKIRQEALARRLREQERIGTWINRHASEIDKLDPKRPAQKQKLEQLQAQIDRFDVLDPRLDQARNVIEQKLSRQDSAAQPTALPMQPEAGTVRFDETLPGIEHPAQAAPRAGQRKLGSEWVRHPDQSFNEGRGGATTLGATKIIDPQTGETYLFKPSTLEDPHSGRHEIASGTVAAELGVRAPTVEMVQFEGKIGTLQKFAAGERLGDIQRKNPARYEKIRNSPEFQRELHQVHALDYLIDNWDRDSVMLFNADQFIVAFDESGRVKEVTAIDHDRTFYDPSGKRHARTPLPKEYSPELRAKIRDLSNNRQALRQKLAASLSPAEIDGLMQRLDTLAADMNSKTPKAGPATSAKSRPRQSEAATLKEPHHISEVATLQEATKVQREATQHLTEIDKPVTILGQIERVSGVEKGAHYDQSMADLRGFYEHQQEEANNVARVKKETLDQYVDPKTHQPLEENGIKQGAEADSNYQARHFHYGEGKPGLTRIHIRVHFEPEPGVSKADIKHVCARAQKGVDHYYNHQHTLKNGDRLHVEVEFVKDKAEADMVVKLSPGRGRADQLHWYADEGSAGQPGTVDAHEIGHNFWLDEYHDKKTPAVGRETPNAPGVAKDRSLMGDHWLYDARGKLAYDQTGPEEKRPIVHPDTGLRERHLDSVHKDVQQAFHDKKRAAEQEGIKAQTGPAEDISATKKDGKLGPEEKTAREHGPEKTDKEGEQKTAGPEEIARKEEAAHVPVEPLGPQLHYQRLDPSRFKEVPFEKGNAVKGKSLLIDRETGEKFLFKPNWGNVGSVEEYGVQRGDYARRAAGASTVFNEAGIQSDVRPVSYLEANGTLQPFIEHAPLPLRRTSLGEIFESNPKQYERIKSSPEFARLKSEIEAFDYAINNRDRNIGNVLVDLGPDGRAYALIPIDHDLAFTSAAPRRLPTKYTRETYEKLKTLRDRHAALSQKLGEHLTPAESEGFFRRVNELIADIEHKLATLHEEGTFFTTPSEAEEHQALLAGNQPTLRADEVATQVGDSHATPSPDEVATKSATHDRAPDATAVGKRSPAQAPMSAEQAPMSENVEFPVPLPQGGVKKVRAAKQGNCYLPIDKVLIYGAGKVQFPELAELKSLRAERKNNQSAFASQKEKQSRLKDLEKKEHNYDRSQGNLSALQKAGLDLESQADMIIHRMLLDGQAATANVGVQPGTDVVAVNSEIAGPDGVLIVTAKWIPAKHVETHEPIFTLVTLVFKFRSQ